MKTYLMVAAILAIASNFTDATDPKGVTKLSNEDKRQMKIAKVKEELLRQEKLFRKALKDLRESEAAYEKSYPTQVQEAQEARENVKKAHLDYARLKKERPKYKNCFALEKYQRSNLREYEDYEGFLELPADIKRCYDLKVVQDYLQWKHSLDDKESWLNANPTVSEATRYRKEALDKIQERIDQLEAQLP